MVGVGAEAEAEPEEAQEPGTETEAKPEPEAENDETDPIEDNPGIATDENDVSGGNPNRFLVNYPDEPLSGEDYFAQKRPFNLGNTGVGRSLEYPNFNTFPSASASTSPGGQQSTYY